MVFPKCRQAAEVLSVVAQAATLAEARDNVYDAVSQIFLRGSHYRTDIADKGNRRNHRCVLCTGSNSVSRQPIPNVLAARYALPLP